MLWVQQAPHFLLIFADSSAELRFADAGLAEGVNKRKLRGDTRLHGNRNEIAPFAFGSGTCPTRFAIN